MSKNILGISCIVLLGILVAAAAVYVKSAELIRDETQEHHRLLCEAVTRAVDNTFIRTRQFVAFAASMSAITNTAGQNREQIRRSLSSLSYLAEQNRGDALTPPLSLLDSKGNVLASSVFTASQAGSAFFQEAIQGRFALQGPEIAKETNDATLLFAEPVIQNRQIVGVLVAHLDLHQLAINALPILRDAGAEHSFALALDATGKVLMHTNFGDLAGISMQDEPWAREMLRRKSGQISYDWVGTQRVAAFAPLPQPGWVIAVSLREEDVLAPQRAVRNWLVGGSLGAAALVLLALYLLLRNSQFHLRAGSALALAEFASELRLPSGRAPDDKAELLHLGLSAALAKARQSAEHLEHALADRRESLQAVFSSMLEGILRVDTEGAVFFANPTVLHMLHCQEKDVLGKPLRTVLLQPVGAAAGSEDLADVCRAVGAPHSQTFTDKILRRQDGSLLLANIVVQPLRLQGRTDGAVLAVSDASLADAQRQTLAAITRAAGAVYFVWDEQCRLVDCGDTCSTFLLAAGKEDVLQDFARFMPERQSNGRLSAEELERRLLRTLNTGNDSCDWQFKNALGVAIPCDLALRRLKICGRPAVLGFARDMRLALEAMEKLASGHTNLRQVLDALTVAVGVVGRGTLLYANQEMEEFFALHGDEPALAPFTPMQDASFAPNQAFLQKIENRHLQLFKPDGTMHDYLLSCFPTEFDGTTALMGWLVDVTWLKHEEQRLIRDKIQAFEIVETNRRFLGQLERDVREPLNGILFALQHAMQSHDAEGHHAAVNAAYTFGKHLQETLSYMLNISGVEPPALVHDVTRFRVTDFFYETLHNFADEAEAKGITFDSRLDPGLPEELVGDHALLRQIIYHLVDNAVKYTVVGGVSVDVAPLPSGKADRAVLHIIVTDTGLGISDTQLDTLFRSFSDGARHPQSLSENTSFGLAMVRSHIRLLGGELCAVSEPEQGTEMHLVLPFALKLPEEEIFSAAADETLPFLQVPLDAAPARSQSAAQTKGRILVVDDITTNMQIMVLILQKMGYEAIGADSGAKALNLLAKEPFDLIFMDIQMPRMSGMETTAHIRNDFTGRYPRDIPIVAMTAHAMLGDPEKYLAAGMSDYLSKPVIIEDIANILNNLLPH
ncbi:MAG: response regulator [Deltaproteobacteria bacterium]|nr:response regulator [Deltaproteobacteria bacterium]